MHRLRQRSPAKSLFCPRLLNAPGSATALPLAFAPNPMPAINLTRLKKQIATLLETVDAPERFWKQFRDLLDFYTNRTARALPRPGDYLPTLHAPAPLLREIERQLAPLAASDPQRIFPLILRLWQEPLFEAHLLAARLLAHLPPEDTHWFDILNAWLTASRDPRVRHTLLTETLRPLRTQSHERFIRLLQNWLKGNTPSPSWQQALIALKPYLQEDATNALPAVFSLLRPVFPAITPALQPHLAELLTLLYNQSPAETRYFLRATLPQVQDPRSQRLLRRMAPALPAALRPLIRQHLSASSQRERK